MVDPTKPSRRLSLQDAVEIWKLTIKGWLQHHIAAKLGVNQGRVSEVLNGKRFPEAKRLSGV
ncbi:helix-turn-helix domain-containing protein [Marivita sp. S6314]|nr:helix-turn-helix domain-containing protein [Marivita sp. S6314]